MVNISGNLLYGFSFHNDLNSSLWFFFMTMARRNGAMNNRVQTPHAAFAHQWGSSWRTKGRKKVSIRNIAAPERIE